MDSYSADVLARSMSLYKLIQWILYIIHMGPYSCITIVSVYYIIQAKTHNVGLLVTIIALGIIPFSYLILMVTLEDIRKGYVVCDVSELCSNTAYLLALLGLFTACGMLFYSAIHGDGRAVIIGIVLLPVIIINVHGVIIPSIVSWFMYRSMRSAKIFDIPCVDIARVARILMSLSYNIVNLDVVEEEWNTINDIVRAIARHDRDVRESMIRFLEVLNYTRTEKLRDEIEFAKRHLTRQYKGTHFFVLGNIFFILLTTYMCMSVGVDMLTSVAIASSIIALFTIAWKLLKRERIVWTYMFLDARMFSLELVKLLKELKDASRTLGESLVKFMAHRLQLNISVGNFKYSIM